MGEDAEWTFHGIRCFRGERVVVGKILFFSGVHLMLRRKKARLRKILQYYLKYLGGSRLRASRQLAANGSECLDRQR